MYKNGFICTVFLFVLFFMVACSKTPSDELQGAIEAWVLNQTSNKASSMMQAVGAIEKGADPATEFEGYTVADMITYTNNYGSDERALFNALINTEYHLHNEYGASTLVEIAGDSGDLATIKTLIAAGVVIEDTAEFIGEVVAVGQPDVTHLVLENFSAGLDEADNTYFVEQALAAVLQSPLEHRETALENLKLFLDKGAIPSQEGLGYMIFTAVLKLEVQNIDLIQKLGGSFNVLDGDNNTLLLAVAKDYNTMISEGDDYSADIIATDEKSAVMYERLTAASIDINAADKSGRTALIVAADSLNVPLVKLLLSKGADKGVADKSGKRAIDYVPEPKKRTEGSKDTAATRLVMALAKEAGLTKKDFAMMLERRATIRVLLQG